MTSARTGADVILMLMDWADGNDASVFLEGKFIVKGMPRYLKLCQRMIEKEKLVFEANKQNEFQFCLSLEKFSMG